MSAACSHVGSLLALRSPTPHLPVAGPIVVSVGPPGGGMRPSLLGVLRCPFCQAAYPVNYSLPAVMLGPGTMGPGLLHGPYQLPPVIVQGPVAPQSWWHWDPLPSPAPFISGMVGPAGPSVHPQVGGPSSSWAWGPSTAQVTCGDPVPIVWWCGQGPR